MNFRTTMALFAVLLLMLVGFGIIVEYRQRSVDEGYLLPAFHGKETIKISKVEIKKGDESYTVFRKGKDGPWYMKSKSSAEQWRVDEGKAKSLIDEVEDARRNEEYGDVTQDLARAGLEDPKLTVTLYPAEEGDGRTWWLKLGRASGDIEYDKEGANVFALSSERAPEVINVKASALRTLLGDVNELRDRGLVEGSVDQAVGLRVEQFRNRKEEIHKGELALAQSDQGGAWNFLQPPGYGAARYESDPAKPEQPSVRNLLATVAAVAVADPATDFVDRGSRPLGNYGVPKDEPPATFQITLERRKGILDKETVKETLLVGSLIEAEKKYYARMADDDYVVKVEAVKLAPIFDVMADPAALRSRDLTQIDPSAPDLVKLYTGPKEQQAIELLKGAGAVWKMSTPGGKLYKADQAAVDGTGGLLETLRGQEKIVSFIEANTKEEAEARDKELGFDTPTAKVEIFVDAVEAKGEEPKVNDGARPRLTLVFGKTGPDTVYVKRIHPGGEVSRVAVPVSVYEAVTPAQGYLAFLNEELPGFDPADVTGVTFARGPDGFVLARKKDEKTKAESWVLEKAPGPARGVDEAQVERLLARLRGLAVEQWVEKDPSPAQLEKFGLAAPALTATLTLKADGGKEPRTVRYQFGMENDKDAKVKGVYAKMSETDIVFLAPAADVKFLQDLELRDRTVFDLDYSKVRQATVEDKNYATLDLKRASAQDQWAVVRPDGFPLDKVKAGDLVKAVAGLKAERFIRFEGGVAPEHKVGGRWSLTVTLQVEGEEKPRVLRLGAIATDESGYYAEASSLPGVEFLVPTAEFRALVNQGIPALSSAATPAS